MRTIIPAAIAIITISAAVPSEQPAGKPVRFSEHLIMGEYSYAYGIAVADLDGDGDLDLTSADCKTHDSLYWFSNNGRGEFLRHFVQKDDPQRLERHAIGDVDRDGHPDVVIVKNLQGHLIWFRNSGTPGDGKLWKRYVITTDLPGAYDVVLVDLDGDKDLDVAASSWRLGNQFAWFENDGSPAEGVWKKHMIEKEIAETRGMRSADFDGDGDRDLLGTASAAGQVIWYENRSGGESFRKHIIDRAPRPTHGEPADMDGDGDFDVVMALGMSADPKTENTHQIVWYENLGKREHWKKHVVAAKFQDAFEAVAADLDGDGDIDVVATSWRTPGRVAWFENTGNPRTGWTMHLLKDNWRSANQVIVADLNGDDRPDIAACAEHGSYELRWWRNEGGRRGAD